MNREWVEQQVAASRIKFEEEKQRVKKEVIDFGKFIPSTERKIIRAIDELKYDNKELRDELFSLGLELEYGYIDSTVEELYDYKDWVENILKYENLKSCFKDFERYLDSEPMEFDGDIIITDPCYITKNDDWSKCDYGEHMEALGLRNYICRDTMYGDWSCTTFNSDTDEKLGEFCADAGMVAVFDLAEVLAYNPEFDYHTDRSWTTTWIKDFKGTVQFVVKHIEGFYKEDTEWWKKGDKWEDYVVEVVGHGVNKVTGIPINFVGRQTGY